MMSEDWFEVRCVAPDLWMIAEPLHVVSWLYIGSERAALLDTGTGIAPIAPIVASLTGRPVVVVNTHYHFDHIGNNPAFKERLASVASGPLMRLPASRQLLDRYLRTYDGFIAEARERIQVDPDAFAMAPETQPREFPLTFNSEEWRPGSIAATGLLRDGNEIDLGDRRLRVIDTPGHSPDGICLVDAERGVLFAGDTLTEGPLYVHYDESSAASLLASTLRLFKLAGDLRVICCGHVARAVAEVSLIDDTIAALRAVLDGRADCRETSDVFGYPIFEARFGRVWITQSTGAATSFRLYDGEPVA
ncbi:MBL fold metallo-hydrolase [Acidisoma sp. S159]|jgi:glyoxylase-like metal-dependent hydrolase (beta-lactamase superfamily II)|uniref:MBL fold metallo-hydrolase n=1 Tax=Acidisoma sp. S159 TaxID=1747225 RepID=UPI001C20A967|nr:MBL fold metallo-hydrolase [Acidisoma sp. S159]